MKRIRRSTHREADMPHVKPNPQDEQKNHPVIAALGLTLVGGLVAAVVAGLTKGLASLR